MPAYVAPSDWIPVGVESLEPAAEAVVRSSRTMVVAAGPGAGKTELLAQRACYLLDTGVCPPPRRILAISFKRDAAKNLKERVLKRCGERATRFDAMTHDAFAKGLIDRFRLGLPEEWRPSRNYEVVLRPPPENDMRTYLISACKATGISHQKIGTADKKVITNLYFQVAHGYRLPFEDLDPSSAVYLLSRHSWREKLGAGAVHKSRLSFPMLNRLASLLLRQNHKLTIGLRSTYSHVFLDEFQDTTSAQYDLILAAFAGAQTVLTAVGDGKQRIMLWAGARNDVFETFTRDFQAATQYLIRNYRSAAELVMMQQVIAEALEPESPVVEPASRSLNGACIALEFDNSDAEADHIADIIESGIRTGGLKPRDFCVLVRQRTAAMIPKLQAVLAQRHIQLRDETELQDLLTEPVVQFLISLLRLATRARDPEAWDYLIGEIGSLLSLDEHSDQVMLEAEAQRLLSHARQALGDGKPLSEIPCELMCLFGDHLFSSKYPQYIDTSFIDGLVLKLSDFLIPPEGDTRANCQIIDDLIGENTVPAMTIHKSKGLEFHTIIFLGLEDSQWWGFADSPHEEKCNFFVAFSRAIKRVYFTYADIREENSRDSRNQKSKIGDLYTILQNAGVPIGNCRRNASHPEF